MMAFPDPLLQTIPQGTDYVRILPELVLSIFGIVVMVLDPLVDEEKSQKTLGLIAFVGSIAALISTWYMAQSPGLAFSNTCGSTASASSSPSLSSPLPPS
jgi:hypothetical protein